VSGPLLLAGGSFHRAGIVRVTAASERAINLKTARELGLDVQPSTMLRGDDGSSELL
jgi:hypothetical protein